jgi:predicted ester cyclase
LFADIVGFVADSSGDALRELVECLYAALDRQDWETFEALVSSRVVVEVGSSAPIGFDEWRGDLEAFYRGFPDGHHVIEEVLIDGSHGVSRCRFVGTHTGQFRDLAPTGTKVSIGAIHIDRFQGDTLVAHRGQLDMHGLMQQLKTL